MRAGIAALAALAGSMALPEAEAVQNSLVLVAAWVARIAASMLIARGACRLVLAAGRTGLATAAANLLRAGVATFVARNFVLATGGTFLVLTARAASGLAVTASDFTFAAG